ncbi:MAG: hypothetical protein QUV05_23555 [Phycisphaerae bacterium]|nr:hypothetical protein [Phycisphaerae bacterium]
MSWSRLVILHALCLLCSALCISAVSPGCGGRPTDEPPVTDTTLITTGDAVDSGGGVLDEGHGTVTVDAPGSPIAGLNIEVPEGAYGQSCSFNIAYRPILTNDLPVGAQFISPLILIDNGGQTANDFMVLTLPISISEDEFAMAFLYDAAENRLDALPLVDLSATSLTFAAVGFGSTASAQSAKVARIQAGAAAAGPSGIAAVKFTKDQLLNLNVDTVFVPGTDDWHFTNRGSYTQPRGLCNGMVLSALWYYIERRTQSEEKLWGRYGSYSLPPDLTTADFVADDDLAIKICTGAQPIAVEFDDKYYNMLAGRAAMTSDERRFCEIAAAMLVNKNENKKMPLSLSVATADWKSRHALLCYAIRGRTLSIADPNWPGQPRTITLNADGKFQPYSSAQNADEISTAGRLYTNIHLCGGKNESFSWDQVGDLFAQADSGALGMNSGGFPDARLRISELDDSGTVTDQYEADLLHDNEVSHRRIRVELSSPAGFEGKLTVYQYGSPPTKTYDSPLTLQTGDNLIGFHIEGFTRYKIILSDGTEKDWTAWRWAGFQWINFIYDPSTAKPTVTIVSPTNGQSFTAGQAVALKATAKDGAGNDIPSDRVVWTSDLDGQIATGTDTSVSDLSIGSHTLTVTATDTNNNSDEASVEITVKAAGTADCPVPEGAVLLTAAAGNQEYYWLDGVGYVGPNQVWTDGTRTQLTHESCRNAAGQYHGWFRNWTNSGILIAELQYANGRYNGVSREFNSGNGQMTLEEHYNDGTRDGLCRAWYYQNGQIKYEVDYTAGKLNGPYTTWYENGQMELQTAYENGLQNGTSKQWTEDGTLLWTCTYDHGTAVECH